MSILPRETIIAGLEAARKIKEGHLPTDEDLSDAPILADWAISDNANELVRLVGWVTAIRCSMMGGSRPVCS